jgi:hypothetical protein
MQRNFRWTRYPVLTIISAAAIFAQSYQGGLRGRVMDAAGAAIPGANVGLVNQNSNATLSTVTNDVGEYAFAALNPADYVLTVERPGFKKFEQTRITIGTQTFLTIDVSLQVGDVTQSVEISGEAPLMETVIPSVGGALNARQLENLPNIGRNPYMALAKSAPNIVPVGDTRYQRFQDQSGT